MQTPGYGAILEELEVKETHVLRPDPASRREDWFEDDAGERILAFRIDFPSGFTIYALPSRPARLRGKQGYAICDEAAQQDLDAWLTAAGGLLIWGGRLALISTYLGAENAFFRYVEECKADPGVASLHEISIYDALADGLYKRICRARLRIEWTEDGEAEWVESLRKLYGEHRFREECEMIVQRSGSALYHREAIERCTVLGPAECTVLEIRGGEDPAIWLDGRTVGIASQSWRQDSADSADAEQRAQQIKQWLDAHLRPALDRINETGLPVYVGLDYGRSHNLSSWTFGLLRRDNRRRVSLVIELEKMRWTDQDIVADYCWERLVNLAGGCADAGGSGEPSAEIAHDHSRKKVQKVKITTAWHDPAFARLGKRIDDQGLQLPSHFAPIVSDLVSLYRGTKGKILAPQKVSKDDRRQKRHADSAYSLALMEQSISTDGPVVLDQGNNLIPMRRRPRRRRRNRR